MGLELPQRAIILDTDFLSFYLINLKSSILKIKEILDEGFFPATTSINKAEMLYGAFKKNWSEKRLDSLTNLLESLFIFEFTSKSSEIYGKLRSDLVLIGQDIGFADTAIASIVIENKLKILTGNINHFNRIKNLEIIPFYQ